MQEATKRKFRVNLFFSSGCKTPGAENLQPSDCLACRVAKDPLTNTCLEKCPKDTEPVEGKECLGKRYNNFLIQFCFKERGIARTSVFL